MHQDNGQTEKSIKPLSKKILFLQPTF